jgi:hypothetical protein
MDQMFSNKDYLNDMIENFLVHIVQQLKIYMDQIHLIKKKPEILIKNI